MYCDATSLTFLSRFQRALAKAEEAATVTTIQSEYERLQEKGTFFLNLLKGTKEESLKIFAERFSQIPMDVMTALKVNIIAVPWRHVGVSFTGPG